MSIEALILGKLHQRPEERLTRTSKPYVTAKVLTAAGESVSCYVNVVAFSDTVCRVLLALDAGDSVALAGTLKPGAWLDREGNPKPRLDLVAAQVLTTYGLKKKRDAAADAGQRDAGPMRAPLTTADGFDAHEDEAWLRGGA
jgi:single-stranded DNA-binding protein